MELVEAGNEKLQTYKELWFSLAKEMEEYSDLNNLVYGNVEDVSEEGFIEHFEDEDYAYYLVEEDGETIGFATLKLGEHPSREYSNYTKIVNLFIKESHRNQGYGSKVVQKVKRIAKEHGSDYLKVSSEWDNQQARKFYKKNSFKEKQVEFTQKLD